jgi:hypothetical protein
MQQFLLLLGIVVMFNRRPSLSIMPEGRAGGVVICFG